MWISILLFTIYESLLKVIQNLQQLETETLYIFWVTKPEQLITVHYFSSKEQRSLHNIYFQFQDPLRHS